MTRSWSCLLATAAVAFVFGGCSGASGPSKDEIAAYLDHMNGEIWDVGDLRIETFVEKDGASGRASCAGDFVLNTDLYENDDQAVRDALKDAVGDRYSVHASPVGQVWGARLVHPAGSRTQFTAELYFRKTVDGWDFDSSPKFERLEGLPFSALHPARVVVGGPEFNAYIERVVEQRKLFDQAKSVHVAKLEKFLAPNAELGWFSNYRGGNPEELFVAKIKGSPQWDSQDAYQAKSLTVPCEVRWSRDGTWYGEKYKEGDVVAATVYVKLLEPTDHGYEDILELWSADIDIRMAGQTPGYRVGHVYWRGEHFQSQPPNVNGPPDAYSVAVHGR